MKRDGLDVSSFEKPPALQQRLRVRQGADHRLAAPKQAMADRVDDLAADADTGSLPHQVVDLLDDPSQRVLDRQDRRIDLAGLERIESARERRKPDGRRVGQHRQRGLFGVRARLALIADARPARMRIHGRNARDPV